MDNIYSVSSSPHVRDNVTTQKIMGAVLLSLLPASICGVIFFGIHALLVIVVSVASSVLSELIFEKITGRDVTVYDLSAAVTGLLIGLNMPPSVPLFVPVLGSVFGVIVVKQLFGGIGQNFMNPALGARCFLLISFSSQMTDFSVKGGIVGASMNAALDAVSSATPLAALKTGGAYPLKDLFLGNILGTIGETSALALLIGAIFLLAIKVIDIKIPLTYIGTFFILVLIAAAVRGYENPVYFALCEVCAGGLMLGAWFMATDYATSPMTSKGQIIYGIGLGILTFLFRMVSKSEEGVSYAIIFMNCLTPMIEQFTRPLAFGIKREKGEKHE
ncbi:MAG: RnfABCDGE type electron transport complex subunit D [Lachnospiraceae bacterium]|nr:RnfABCDGE type electron transport complex subunit D [Lachnospiraceae bacterium]